MSGLSVYKAYYSRKQHAESNCMIQSRLSHQQDPLDNGASWSWNEKYLWKVCFINDYKPEAMRSNEKQFSDWDSWDSEKWKNKTNHKTSVPTEIH